MTWEGLPDIHAPNGEWDVFLKARYAAWRKFSDEVACCVDDLTYLGMTEAEYAAWQNHGFVYPRVRKLWSKGP